MILPTPQQLRYLTSLAELRHFGRAAAACGVTQSTLSAGILALERQLGAVLLDRTGRKPVFTPVGREITERARTALAALEAVAEAAAAADEPLSGVLHLGIIPTLAPFVLPRLLPALREHFPNLRLKLNEDVTAQLCARLAVGALDLLLIALPSECDGLETREVGRDPLLAAVPAGHDLANGPISLADLEHYQMLLLEDGHCLRDQVLDACRQAGAWRHQAVTSPFAATSLHTLVQLVENGFGVTLLPQIAVRSGLVSSDRVVIRPLSGEPVYRTIGLACRPGSSRENDLSAIATLLQDCLSR
ncbi:hydrogen peroxide-inducible genes activator [Acetobacteraceae bacterium KSS8]|uniref:Hydrogen peroxide-inducible genes activator n=1 Tax=Endosaccharibacter trunci TaxID=2812733 RepID=A0ABT1W349_9PROT|nr:hydrogen peroxide-inducible genes activator [Acetobacteraceae bacterium KSS8]